MIAPVDVGDPHFPNVYGAVIGWDEGAQEVVDVAFAGAGATMCHGISIQVF